MASKGKFILRREKLARLGVLVAVMAALLLISTGCTSTGGASDGWVVVDPPERTPPPPPPQPARKTKPPEHARKNRGQEQAGNNHLRSAYRFLEKNRADHALKELEKAGSSLGTDFRVYYYMGGAYFYKGMYDRASDTWQAAYRYTRNARLRSRLRTCQAYALIHIEGDPGSIPFLEKAIDLDAENRHAEELLRSLERTRERKTGTKKDFEKDPRHPPRSGTVEHSRFAEELIRGKYDTDHNVDRRHGDEDYYEDRDFEDGKPGRKGQGKDHGDKVPDMDIRDLTQFKGYFLIEMF
jgi:tetratricopeptide (TPR) repeat protein